MRSLLMVLALAWVLFVPLPALAQTSQGGSSAPQYDQYGFGGFGVGGRAAHDAIVASGAIQAIPEEAQTTGGDAAAAAEAQDESASTPDIEELPETGGPSPLWFGVPLVCAGTLLARRILF